MPAATPTSVAGIVTSRICGSPTADPESAPTSATVTAETGDAVSPCCAAITLTESGRSGRIPALRETSAMIGRSA